MKKLILTIVFIFGLAGMLFALGITDADFAYRDFMNGKYTDSISENATFNIRIIANRTEQLRELNKVKDYQANITQLKGVFPVRTFDFKPGQKVSMSFSSKDVQGDFFAAIVNMQTNKLVKTFKKNQKYNLELKFNKQEKYCLVLVGYNAKADYSVSWNIE
ncbi:MAG TPA: hypothetical protein QF753_21540 [Victivallales bacterium]|nr:hypothetical protein [Victivallales bacterium]